MDTRVHAGTSSSSLIKVTCLPVLAVHEHQPGAAALMPHLQLLIGAQHLARQHCCLEHDGDSLAVVTGPYTLPYTLLISRPSCYAV